MLPPAWRSASIGLPKQFHFLPQSPPCRRSLPCRLQIQARRILCCSGIDGLAGSVQSRHLIAQRFPQGSAADLYKFICFVQFISIYGLNQQVAFGLPAFFVDRANDNMQIECVHDPNALKKAAVQKTDMIFLDIDMGDVNGIALARQMRTIRKDAVLIFVTNYGEYAAEGYEVSAFRFLPKLQLAEKLPDYFRQALAACRSRTRTLNALCDGEGTNIVLDELVYVETEERMLIFHRAEPAAPLKSRMSLRTLEEKLAEDGFLRIHNSFLINMSYIAALQTSGVTLTTGQTLPISLHGYKTIKTKYMAWRGRS